MATIAELAVNVTARTAGFEAGMRRTQSALSGFAKSGSAFSSVVSQLSSGFTRLTSGIGGFAAGLGLGVLALERTIAITRKVAAEFDTLAETSEKLGMGPAALQTLQYAGGFAGVTPEELESSFTRLAKGIGDANKGVKASAEAFTSLGLNPGFLKTLEADRQFLAVADAISKLGTQSEKVAATMAIFGRGGSDLVRMLEMGSAGFEAMRKELESFGIIVDSQALKSFEKLEDSQHRLSAAWHGFSVQLATEVAPALTKVVGGATSLLKKVHELRAVQAPWWLGRREGLLAMTWQAGIWQPPTPAGPPEAPPIKGGPFGVEAPIWARRPMAPPSPYFSRLVERIPGLLASPFTGLQAGIGAIQMRNLRAGLGDLGAMFRGLAAGQAAIPYRGPNIGLAVGGLESQAARQRARWEAEGVPRKQLEQLQKISAGIQSVIAAIRGGDQILVEEVVL